MTYENLPSNDSVHEPARPAETAGDRLVSGAAGGAAVGAVFGLIVPAVGPVIGSVIGGLTGAGFSGWRHGVENERP